MTTGTVPSASTWGSPAATKHTLLLHGLTSSSHTWHSVAASLASQGYLVTAPNLIGHASRTSTSYHLTSIVDDLLPYITSRTYDLIIGHSMGGITVLGLLQHLPQSHPTAIVLVDPPLRHTKEEVELLDGRFSEALERVKTAEEYSRENPLWSHEDCVMRGLGARLFAAEVVHRTLRQNDPWYFIDYLKGVSSEWKGTILIADPAVFKVCPIEDVEAFPYIRPVIVPRAGHWIHYDFPEVVVEEALKTVAELHTV